MILEAMLTVDDGSVRNDRGGEHCFLVGFFEKIDTVGCLRWRVKFCQVGINERCTCYFRMQESGVQ